MIAICMIYLMYRIVLLWIMVSNREKCKCFVWDVFLYAFYSTLYSTRSPQHFINRFDEFKAPIRVRDPWFLHATCIQASLQVFHECYLKLESYCKKYTLTELVSIWIITFKFCFKRMYAKTFGVQHFLSSAKWKKNYSGIYSRTAH